MSSEYLSDVENFFTNEDVTGQESVDGASFLVGAVLVATAVVVVVWWRRRTE